MLKIANDCDFVFDRGKTARNNRNQVGEKMSKNVSIMVTMKDGFSDTVSKMKDAGVHFNKNLEEMQAQLNMLNDNRATLKLDTKAAENNLKALQKEYLEAKQTGDGVVSRELLERLKEANSEYEQARFNLKELNKAASDTERAMEKSNGTFKKAENSISGSAGAGKGIFGALASAGVIKMGGDLLAEAVSADIASAYGDMGSTYLSSILSNAASGAAAGFVLGGGVPGAVIGGAVGVGAGLIDAGTKNFTKEDEYFKSYRDEMLESETNTVQNDISAGSAMAAEREMDKIAFDKLLKTDSTETLAGIRTMANETPFLYEDLKEITKTLATYGYSPEEMGEKLVQIGDTGAALGMNSSEMSMVATGLGRMKSSGKTTLEYLNLLIERGIPAVDYLADAMGVSNGEVYEMVSKGLIPGADAANVIANAMGKANSGAMEQMAETFSGLASTLEGLKQEEQTLFGEGYNERRKIGIEAQVEYFDSAEHDEVNKAIGAYYAELENEKERIRTEHEKAAYERIKAEGITDEAEMGRILAKARIAAQAEYNATEGAQIEAESQRALINEVGSMLAGDKTYWNAGYLEGVERSKGMRAAMKEYVSARYEENGYPMAEKGLEYSESRGMSEAFGMDYVPYNGFAANLHEGERVLTAAEAREYRNEGKSGGVTVNIGSMTVREEADIERVADEIARKITLAQAIS